MRISRIALVTACLGSALAANGAQATTATATMNNTAAVAAYCTVSTGSLAFGTYTGSADSTTSANVSVTCTNTTSYTVALNAGTTTGATETARKLKAATSAATLAYSISSDAGSTTNWGTTAGAQTGTGTGAAQTLTAYGKIAAGQFVTPDNYADTVTVTLTY
jgi:spore coat protein U-like protein